MPIAVIPMLAMIRRNAWLATGLPMELMAPRLPALRFSHLHMP